MTVLADSSYPLMNAFWTMIVFFAWVIWIMLLFRVFADLFTRSDISGWGKAGWTAFVLVLPFIGVLVYLVAQGGAMARRQAEQQQASRAEFDSYVRSVAASSTQATDEIGRAKKLLDSGAITSDEYEKIKQKALAG